MENLISLEEYKLAKGLSKSEHDDQLNMLIRNVSSIIQTYLGRNFSDTGEIHSEVLSLDYDTQTLYLEKYPVSEIISITEADPYGYDSSVHFPVSSSNYFLDMKYGKLIRVGSYWSKGPGAIIVTYRVPEITEIPPDLKQATIDLITYYRDEEWKPSKQTRGATITNAVGGSRGTSYTTEFPAHIQRVLDLYR